MHSLRVLEERWTGTTVISERRRAVDFICNSSLSGTQCVHCALQLANPRRRGEPIMAKLPVFCREIAPIDKRQVRKV